MSVNRYFLLLFVITWCTRAENLPLQHGVVFQQEIVIADYWVSEKLDGVRGFWDGKTLYFRSGKKMAAPRWFTQHWPNVALDGEIWQKRGAFESTSGCVRQKTPSGCWQKLTFNVFDLNQGQGTFTTRLNKMTDIILTADTTTIKVIPQWRIRSLDTLFEQLERYVENGAEGLMLHHQDALYRKGRNPKLLKLKKYQDDEAVVIKHLPGKGKYQGLTGALLVETPTGLKFKIGSGLSDQLRKSPPALGSTITYRYIGKTQRGVPRFASFIRLYQPE